MKPHQFTSNHETCQFTDVQHKTG